MKLNLPRQGTLVPNDKHDPLPYYYHPLVGWLYRMRLNMGLSLIPPSRKRVLEVGVGSGVLIPTLTEHFEEYLGIDLVLSPNLSRLVNPPCKARFMAADLLDESKLPESHFDVVVCLSVLEHIGNSDQAAKALARLLAPSGTLVTGYPMVNTFMARAFQLIGFDQIEQHHIAPPTQIEGALGKVLRSQRRIAMPPLAPTDLALYQCTAWVKA